MSIIFNFGILSINLWVLDSVDYTLGLGHYHYSLGQGPYRLLLAVGLD